MGSDLNYADMADRELADYDYHFYEKGPEQVFDGVKTWANLGHSPIKRSRGRNWLYQRAGFCPAGQRFHRAIDPLGRKQRRS